MGKTRDLTTGSIGRAMIAFTLPTLASSVLQSLNGSINTVWIGHLLGEGALAATSNCNLVMFLMSAGVFGFGMAATILVGQSMGRRDLDAARRAVGAAVGLVLAIGVLTAVVGWIGAPALLRLLATPGPAMALALTYLRVILLSMPAAFLLVILMMGLRGAGDSLTPLWFMGLSVLLDSGLNPVFIRGFGPIPALGIAGSATATAVANYLSLAALVVYVYVRDLPLRLRGAELRYLSPDPELVRIIVSKGLPMAFQMMVVSVAALTMIGLVNRRGLATTAAYGVASQLWTYIQMPSMAIGSAVSAMAAQNIGAGRWDRIGRITRSGLLFNLVMTGGLILLVGVADRAALAIFLPAGSPAIPIAAHINLVVSWGFVLFGATMVLMGVVRANGSVIAPLVMLAIAMFPVRIGAAVGLGRLLGPEALWWSYPLGSGASVLMAAAYYRFGGWRAMRMGVSAAAPDAEQRALAPAEQQGAGLHVPA
ncbi:MATE family efflux transporter [Caulobacter sp. S45]|uniref:MATE family efflux transporter n=1 Tax=Caulobacter sp. S45 TaxID=1641861 RepID=UPI001C2D8EFB|nr:MATE family efflux transporter [Caulobacter sp. S45]